MTFFPEVYHSNQKTYHYDAYCAQRRMHPTSALFSCEEDQALREGMKACQRCSP